MDYSDIIDLPYNGLPQFPHMAMSDRAAQFSPFAALTGYDDLIDETTQQLLTEADQIPDPSEWLTRDSYHED